MTRTALALLLLSSVGCTSATVLPSVAVEARPSTHESSPPRETAFVSTDTKPTAAPLRAVGDFVVFKFSGTYRKGALTLREQIVGRQGDDLIVEFTFVDGVKKNTFRALTGAGAKSDLTGFTKLDAKGATIDASRDEFEAFMGKTVLAADDNEETLGTTTADVDLAGKQYTAKTTSFRVRVGKTSATMKITQADDFAWGDLGAEIVATDGTVLYRAELLEAGHVSE